MIRFNSWGLALGLMLLAAVRAGAETSFDYGLEPQAVADGVHVLLGRTEHFTRENGGNIVNTGFIVTDDGVVVIDTGPSRRYGEQMRAAIARSTGQPVRQVYLTHAHPDHFLGSQAFVDVPVAALAGTRQSIRTLGDALNSNLYRLVGGWMAGTEAVVPAQVVEDSTVMIGGRSLRLIALNGHTTSDLAVFDEQSATLFAGDLVFFDRAATTPDADIDQWLHSLERLRAIDFKVLVPGHGPVLRDAAGIEQTRAYLGWLAGTLRKAARNGMDLNEAMRAPLPPEFAKIAVIKEEFERSVIHLYPEYELETLAPVSR